MDKRSCVSERVMGECLVGHWMVGVISFKKMFGLSGLKGHMLEKRWDVTFVHGQTEKIELEFLEQNSQFTDVKQLRIHFDISVFFNPHEQTPNPKSADSQKHFVQLIKTSHQRSQSFQCLHLRLLRPTDFQNFRFMRRRCKRLLKIRALQILCFSDHSIPQSFVCVRA